MPMLPFNEFTSPGVRDMVKLNKYALPIYMILRTLEEVKGTTIWSEISVTKLSETLEVPKSRISFALSFLVEMDYIKRIGKLYQLGAMKNGVKYYFIYQGDTSFCYSQGNKKVRFRLKGSYAGGNNSSSKSSSSTHEISSRREDIEEEEKNKKKNKIKNISSQEGRYVEESASYAESNPPELIPDRRNLTRKELADYYLSYSSIPTKNYNVQIVAGKFFHLFRKTRKHYPNLKADNVVAEFKRALTIYPHWFNEDMNEHDLSPIQVLDKIVEVALAQKVRGKGYLSFFADTFCDRNLINRWGWYDNAMDKLLSDSEVKIKWQT